MAKPLTPIEQKQLSALVEIIPNTDIHLVQEALDSGYYRGVSLSEAKEFLLEHEDFKNFRDSLSGSTAYNRPDFEEFLEKIKTHPSGLYDRLKRTLWNNDKSLLDPHESSEIPTLPTTGELTPPHTLEDKKEPLPPPQQQLSTSEEDSQSDSQENPEEDTEEEVPEEHSALSSQGQERLNQINRSMQRSRTNRPTPTERPPISTQKIDEKLKNVNKSMQEAKKTTNQPGQPSPQISPEMEDKLNRVNRSLRSSRQTALNSQNRKKAAASVLKPTTAPSSGGAIGALNNYMGLRDLVNLGRWAANRLGLNGLGNLLSKFFTPEKLLGQALRGLGNLGASLGRAALNGLGRGAAQLLPRLGAQAALQAGRGLLMGAGSIGAALVTTGALAIWGIVIAVIVISLGILWLYNDMIANSECNKPAGEMRVEKRITNSLDSNDPSIRNEDPEIRYIIEMSYELLCKNRKLETVTVTDKIPEGVRYDPDHPTARSGFRNDDSSGPEGVYDPTTNTLTWTFTNFPTLSPVYIYFNTQRETTDSWVVNEATVKYTVSGPTGGKIISSQSQSFEQAIAGAANNANMPPALLKAVLSIEAPKVLEYSEEEFLKFSQPGWWEGVQADAPSLAQNDPDAIRGYAYNTCAYSGSCGAGNDVRGVAQFLSTTWDGIAPKLAFSDNHKPDRRNATDAIYGSAIYNRQNAEGYVGGSNVTWTEDVVRAMARMYCAGPGAAKNPEAIKNKACGWDGTHGYDDFVWRNYQIYSGAQ